MAEVVQYRLEGSLSEIQDMKNLNLFEQSELKQITKRRTNYEYIVQRVNRTKDDYLKYIEYEMNLYKLVKLKCKRRGSQTDPRIVLNSVNQRVKRLYTQAITRFRDDVQLWLAIIDFSKQACWKTLTSNTFSDLLKVHGDKPELWIAAAKWEYEDNQHFSLARKLLIKGLRFKPNSKSLYLALFDLELRSIEAERKKVKKVSEKKQDKTKAEVILSGVVANTVYQNAVQNITDVAFVISFIEACQNYSYACNLEKSMYRDLIVKFPTEETAWEAVACRSLNSWNSKLERKTKKHQTTFQSLKESFTIFDIAVKVVNTEKMWSLYIQFCLNHLKDDKIHDKTELSSKVLEVFSNACDCDHLSADGFMQWYQLAVDYKGSEFAEEIISRTLTRYPQDHHAWQMKVALTMKKGNSKEIGDALEKAMSNVSPKSSLEILLLAIRWYTTIGDNDKVKQQYENALAMASNVSARLKVDYLEWTAKNSGTNAAFKLFRRIWSMSPICKETMYKMCELELTKMKPSMKRLQEIMEYAIKNFGKSDVDLWIHFVKLAREHSDEISGVAKIHSRAIRTLTPQLVDQFITHYTLLTTIGS